MYQVEFVELTSGEFALKAAVDHVRSLKGAIPRRARDVSISTMNAAIKRRAARR